MFVRRGLVALLVAAISWSTPAPGAQAAVDEPPYLSDPDVDPSALPAAGGTITTSVSVTDDHGVDQVQALIGDSEGIVMYLDLEPESDARYTGTWTVPSNDSPDPEPYTVWFRAYDDTGAEGNSVSVDFTVAGAPPSPSRLSLSKRRLTFGPVRAGRSVSRTVVLRNRGDGGGRVHGAILRSALPAAGTSGHVVDAGAGAEGAGEGALPLGGGRSALGAAAGRARRRTAVGAAGGHEGHVVPTAVTGRWRLTPR